MPIMILLKEFLVSNSSHLLLANRHRLSGQRFLDRRGLDGSVHMHAGSENHKLVLGQQLFHDDNLSRLDAHRFEYGTSAKVSQESSRIRSYHNALVLQLTCSLFRNPNDQYRYKVLEVLDFSIKILAIFMMAIFLLGKQSTYSIRLAPILSTTLKLALVLMCYGTYLVMRVDIRLASSNRTSNIYCDKAFYDNNYWSVIRFWTLIAWVFSSVALRKIL